MRGGGGWTPKRGRGGISPWKGGLQQHSGGGKEGGVGGVSPPAHPADCMHTIDCMMGGIGGDCLVRAPLHRAIHECDMVPCVMLLLISRLLLLLTPELKEGKELIRSGEASHYIQ